MRGALAGGRLEDGSADGELSEGRSGERRVLEAADGERPAAAVVEGLVRLANRKRCGVSYLERTVIGLGPATRENIRGYLVHLGEIAAEAGEVAAARFVDRRLAELDTRQSRPGPERLLSPFWIEELMGLLLSIRDGEPALNEAARAWANGVLTVLHDMRRHPEAFAPDRFSLVRVRSHGPGPADNP